MGAFIQRRAPYIRHAKSCVLLTAQSLHNYSASTSKLGVACRMTLERSSAVHARRAKPWVGLAGREANAISCGIAASRSAAAKAAHACALPVQARNRSFVSDAEAASASEAIAHSLHRTSASDCAAHASRLRHRPYRKHG